MLSAIKYGWKYRNGGAQIDGRNILHTPGIQYATPVKNLLFLARLEFTCKTGCVSNYFQYKIGHMLIFFPKSQPQILNYQILNICRVLYLAYWEYFGSTRRVRVLAVLTVPVPAAPTGRNTASTCQYPQHRSLKYLKYSSIPHCTSRVQYSNSEPRNTTSMTLSAVHNLEKGSKYCEYSQYLKYFLSEILFYTPRYWEHLWKQSFADR